MGKGSAVAGGVGLLAGAGLAYYLFKKFNDKPDEPNVFESLRSNVQEQLKPEVIYLPPNTSQAGVDYKYIEELIKRWGTAFVNPTTLLKKPPIISPTTPAGYPNILRKEDIQGMTTVQALDEANKRGFFSLPTGQALEEAKLRRSSIGTSEQTRPSNLQLLYVDPIGFLKGNYQNNKKIVEGAQQSASTQNTPTLLTKPSAVAPTNKKSTLREKGVSMAQASRERRIKKFGKLRTNTAIVRG